MLWFLILFLVVSALTSALTYLRGFSFSKLSVLLRIKVSKSLLYFQLHFSLNPNQSKCTPKGSLNDLIIWNLFHWSLTKSVTDVWFIFVFVYGKWQWIHCPDPSMNVLVWNAGCAKGRMIFQTMKFFTRLIFLEFWQTRLKYIFQTDQILKSRSLNRFT